MRRPDRTGRAVEVLLGVVLVVVGALALVRGAGGFGDRRADAPLVEAGLVDRIAEADAWLPPVALVVGVVLVGLGLRWLRALLAPRPSVGVLAVQAADGGGTTEVASAAVAEALAADVGSDPDVHGTGVRILDDDPVDVDLRVATGGDVDLAALRRRLHDGAVAHLAQALERPIDQIRVRVRFDLDGEGATATARDGLRPAVPAPPSRGGPAG